MGAERRVRATLTFTTDASDDAATTPALRELFDELAGADGIAWRDRHNPTYQITRTEGRF